MHEDNLGALEYQKDKLELFTEETREELSGFFHYHGGMVRKLFMFAAAIMVITLPFIHDFLLPKPPYFAVLILPILGVALFAGWTNATQRYTIEFDLIFSIGAMIGFEYEAMLAYHTNPTIDLYFLTNHVLALLFLFASYYAMKTFRSRWL